MIEIFTVGGYNEVGKNCTVVKINNTAIILDMGLHLENYIKLTEDDDVERRSRKELVDAGAIPNLSRIMHLKDNVKAIIPTHAHLDHVGAIPYLATLFKAPILCTPFTKAVIENILRDEKIELKNEIKPLQVHSVYHINDDVRVEFINITHSTPQTVMVALHTKEGVILYANDFKFDRYPTLGSPPQLERLKQLGEKGVKVLIVDSTYAKEAIKMPSESVAKQMLKDVMLGTVSKDNAVIVTTFSSHIARLKSIVEFSKMMNRKPMFLGRSLAKYTDAAEKVGIANFSKEVEIVKYGNKIRNKLKSIKDSDKKKYVFVVTGHQGEQKSTLSKIINGEIEFKLKPEDQVIFSCKVIPTKTNIDNRNRMEKIMSSMGLRIFKDIHVSGHAAREDLRDLINLVKPKNIIPAHGDRTMTSAMLALASEMGYSPKKTVHLMSDMENIKL